jgi:hypothetical protein
VIAAGGDGDGDGGDGAAADRSFASVPPLSAAGSLTDEDALFAEARALILREFGERMEGVVAATLRAAERAGGAAGAAPGEGEAEAAAGAPPRDAAIRLALDALASLVPRDAALARSLAGELGIAWSSGAAPEGAAESGAGGAPATPPRAAGGGAPARAPPRGVAVLFGAVPELEALLPDAAAAAFHRSAIRVTAPPGGAESPRSPLRARALQDDAERASDALAPRVHTRVLQPTGGASTAQTVL